MSADRIAASFTDTRGGIGRTFFLHLDSGETVSATAPAPTGRKAIAGPGQFLIGSQGYGAFTTSRFGRDGAETGRWASHGPMLVDKNGSASGPELENRLPSRSRLRRLAPDNTLVHGPALTGYYTSDPAMDCEGTAVFWRDGKLLAVDKDLASNRQELWMVSSGFDAVISAAARRASSRTSWSGWLRKGSIIGSALGACVAPRM